MLGHSTFGWPLVIGGTIKATYDLLLLRQFRDVRPPEETAGGVARCTFTWRSPSVMHPRRVDIGPGELLIVLAVLLLVFGSSQLPKLGRSLGEAMREVRHWSRDDERTET